VAQAFDPFAVGEEKKEFPKDWLSIQKLSINHIPGPLVVRGSNSDKREAGMSAKLAPS